MTWDYYNIEKTQDAINNFKRFGVSNMQRVNEMMKSKQDFLEPHLEELLRNPEMKKLIYQLTDDVENLAQTLIAFGKEVVKLQNTQDDFAEENA